MSSNIASPTFVCIAITYRSFILMQMYLIKFNQVTHLKWSIKVVGFGLPFRRLCASDHSAVFWWVALNKRYHPDVGRSLVGLVAADGLIFVGLAVATMDPSDLSSFRPVSNLSFISKLLERVIDSKVTEHANINGLFSPVQSAYRKFHSTETALVKVHNDLVISVDEVGALCSLTCPLRLILSSIRLCSASSSVGLLLQMLRSLGFTHTCQTGHMSFTPRPEHRTSSHWPVECLRAQCLVPRPS